MVFHLVSISNPHHLDIILQEIQLVAELLGKARIPQDRHNDLTENDQRIRHLRIIRHHRHPADGI